MTEEWTTSDQTAVQGILDEVGTAPENALAFLQAVHQRYQYLPLAALEQAAVSSRMTLAQLSGVASFYPHFRLKPVGRHRIRLCSGTACHVKGAPLIWEALRRELKITGDEDTDADRRFTLEKVACLGCCTLAPVMQVGDWIVGRVTHDRVGSILTDYLARPVRKNDGATFFQPPESEQVASGEIRIGLGSCCQARGSATVWDSIETVIRKTKSAVTLKRVGCVGMCSQTPLVEVIQPGHESTLYTQVQAGDADLILRRHFAPANASVRWRASFDQWVDSVLTDAGRRRQAEIKAANTEGVTDEFLRAQIRITTDRLDSMDPLNGTEYGQAGGFEMLRKSLMENDPEGVIRLITASGLRGRGGAGFPTGVKWSHVRRATGTPKYVIVNGDEGDPGAFMDRMLLESAPYRILEGMLIAAFAVGASEGIFYVRSEYPLALKRLREAIRQAGEAGWLGDRVGGSGWSFRAQIVEGAGAFVCGEESALLASIEGQRGHPRWRPPYPAERGLQGMPTLVNNVETLAAVPWILRQGAESYAALGTPRSKGTKVFALAGKVRRGGLIEVPMGISIRRIVEDLGGGVLPGRVFKAVQLGGPSGGCLPAHQCDLPIDYEALTAAGVIMGSGGLIVLDDTDCMVEMARYFLEFTQDQSCGKCVYCRIGTSRLLEILTRLCAGKGRGQDLDLLKELAEGIRRSSLCGLGRTAPNPVLTTLRYFQDEVKAHLEGRCPAGRCRGLISFEVTDRCIGCTLCAQHCPVRAIEPRPYENQLIDQEICIRCGICREICPEQAIRLLSGRNGTDQKSGKND
jgi:NADH:ubiquinone oxidoreductase subunit F (NADH-binding)/NADH:ubiquinone oxidoreductase subunit E/Pyruvate/2-oxoacid:ferredoxin oxidoreductase delta subunit